MAHVNPMDIVNAIERAAKNGERVPADMILWLARYSWDQSELLLKFRLDVEYAQEPYAKDDEVEKRFHYAMKAYKSHRAYYTNPEKHDARVYEFPKTQSELWEAVSTKMASALVTLIERETGDNQTIVDPALIAALTALNGYNSMTEQPLGDFKYDQDPDPDPDPDPSALCRFCTVTGAVPYARCPACKADPVAPSSRLGMNADFQQLAAHVVPMEDRAKLTEHEVDACAVGYWRALETVRFGAFPELLLKVWEDWGDGIARPHPRMVDETPSIPSGPLGPGEAIDVAASEFDRAPLLFRALRNEPEDAFIVARMKPGTMVARLDEVEEVVCTVKTTPGVDRTMRKDYRAAEAFAALLTALPALMSMVEFMEFGLDPRKWTAQAPELDGISEVVANE